MSYHAIEKQTIQDKVAGGNPGLKIWRQMLVAAFFIGPALLVLSVGAYTLGIGLIPPGQASWVEGIFGSYALLLFVPIYLELSRRLIMTNKVMGTITAVTGLCGAVTGFAHELFRVIEYTLRAHGATDALFESFYKAPGWEYLLVALLGPLFPLTSILLGVGFLKAKTLPAWVAISLILAGLFFPLAQVLQLDIALKILYPLSGLLWLAALWTVGNQIRRE